ncbi:sterol desaturase family protein [Saccharobesus litoralis]|uniref:Sterol desaturase family protein n=1 Tax=Saccharobesus litoralis TaxID=2172099 RepID=A0A2S0VSY7_9ALTE|nr:sterol desaturase family protein [Saccharobesus litoralis]AWB67324.1 sterol desaturase family protein [Saccharobesus litoralis]
MQVVLDFLQSNLNDLLDYVNDPNKRLFWGYLVSATLLAVSILALTAKSTLEHTPTANKSLLAHIFNFRVWLNKTSRQDYLLWLLNKLIRSLLIVPLLFSMVPIALCVSKALSGILPVFSLTVPQEQVFFIFTTLLFLLDDFSRFFLHWLLHKVPVLWAFHQVHHSATRMTPFTVYRSHPIENMLYAMRMALAQGIAVGICFYLFGPKLQMIDILGANLFIFAFNIMGSNLRHSHIWWSWGKMEKWFISPAQHQLHHSRAREHYDCNLGTALTIWDRLFGTAIYATKQKQRRLRFGINHPNLNTSFVHLYWVPFVDAWKNIVRLFQTRNKKGA